MKNHVPADWFNQLSAFLRGPTTADLPVYTPFKNETDKAEYQPLLYRVHKRKAGESVYRILFYRTKGAHYGPVSTFKDLMHKLVEHVKKPEPTYFMAYTPALGFLALEEREWEDLKEAMMGNAKNIRLICPLEPDIKSFHQGFMGRKTERAEKIEQGLIVSANQAAEAFITEVDSVGPKVKRLAWSTLPSYYLFFGRSWGIITVPFFVPDPNPNADAQSIGKRHDRPNVEMFGMLTTDKTTIDQFLGVFEEYSARD